MSNKNYKSQKTQDQVPSKLTVSRSEAGRRLDRFQAFIGFSLIFSAAFGSYLLATDKSLWILAISHAYGLLAICAIDLVLAALNFLSVRKVLFPTLGWAILTILLQVGDIATAPQFGMKIPYFARYLFGLWAFDGILLMQGIIIVIGLSGRSYQRLLAKRRRQQSYFDMGLKSSRRDFLQIGGTIGAFFVLAAALGIWTTLTPPENLPTTSTPSTGGNSATTQTSNLPSGAIANINGLQVGVPQYFDYPSSGYTNMLMKKADGTVTAISILCTHVCCQCQYRQYDDLLVLSLSRLRV